MPLNQKRLLYFAIGFVLIIGIVGGVSWFIENPLQVYVLKRANASLKGYEVQVRNLYFHPLGFSVELDDVRVYQQQHPTPPVAEIRSVTMSIHWKALFYGRLVADLHMESPVVTIDLTHIRKELGDGVPIENKGWQKVTRIYPFKINLFTVDRGKLSYIGRGDMVPLVLDQLRISARNIRNISNTQSPYPSEVELSSRVFGYGKITFEGRADFMTHPHPGFSGQLLIDNIPLEGLSPVVNGSPVSIDAGTIESIRASLEYSRSIKHIHVAEARIRGLKSSYIYPDRSEALRSEVKKAAAGKKARPDEARIRIDKLLLTKGNIGVINRKTDPQYRVFVSETRLSVENYSKSFENGAAVVRLRGAFMGSGSTAVYGTFRPEKKGSDFDLHIAIQDTRISDMNALLKAYAGFDATAGSFTFFSEVTVHGQRIDGYVKPLFRNVAVLDKEQDRHDGLLQQLYEGVVDVLAKLLENAPRDEVATKTDISGKLDNPDADTPEILLNLIRNAFFDAILPGFDERISP